MNKLFKGEKYCLSCKTNIKDEHIHIQKALPMFSIYTTGNDSVTTNYKCCTTPNIIDIDKESNVLNLIDADSILYIFAHRYKGYLDIDYDYVTEYSITTQLYNQLKKEVSEYINDILAKTNSRFYLGMLGKSSDKSIENNKCFRYDICTTFNYKEKRNTDSSVIFWRTFITKVLIEEFNFIEISRIIEVDDMLSLLNTTIGNKYDIIISGQDKDLLQIPTKHYNYKFKVFTDATLESSIILEKKNKKNTLVGYGYKFLYAQCIIGDKADDIPGVKGKGDVAAFKVLKDCKTEEECKNAVVQLYIEEGLEEINFIENYRALKLLEVYDVDYLSNTDKEFIESNLRQAENNIIDIYKSLNIE